MAVWIRSFIATAESRNLQHWRNDLRISLGHGDFAMFIAPNLPCPAVVVWGAVGDQVGAVRPG